MSDTAKPKRARWLDLKNPFLTALEGMTELLLVRHGEQQISANMPVGDVVDAPLSSLGHEQARVVGERLATAEIDAVYCSPLSRARITGEQIARHHDLGPIVHEGLREIDQFQKMPQQLGVIDHYGAERFVELMREQSRTGRDSVWPDAEDVPAFRRRVTRAVAEIAAGNQGRRVVVACHAGVINHYLAETLSSSIDQMFPLHHTSITTIRVDGDRQAVLSVNDFSHVHEVQTSRNDLNG
ncbi:MAG: histidine phosphatase family protein [Dehalococcoidia bacterium]|nr:histidine phosphatase family protein [Dehalococcoidia bacterium]|tara:strand:+ start:1353 stop:2072 length:720 start_codon:yes stop_codon:yes gene_type:complete